MGCGICTGIAWLLALEFASKVLRELGFALALAWALALALAWVLALALALKLP